MATRFRVSQSWVRRIKQQRREFGKTAPATTRRRTPRWRAIEGQIRAALAGQPDLTLRELQAKESRHDPLSADAVHALRALKLTLKKKS